MHLRHCVAAALLFAVAISVHANAGYLDENPEEVFADVYARLGVKLPTPIARDPYVWLRLEELKREACDQKSVNDLSQFLEKQGYRREAAESLYNFVRKCGAPVDALHRSVDIFLKLSDYPKAVEVADEFIRRAPSNHNAHYLRGVALDGTGDFNRALTDYADAIELFSADKKQLGSTVFLRMANAYASLGQFCEAASPVYAWVAIDPVSRDNSRTQKIISDYERRGNCATAKEFQKERYPLRGQKNVVPVKAEVNGIKGIFILDTGASYVSMKSEFAERAKISSSDANEITLFTANGAAKGRLSKANKVQLGKLEATNVPVVVQKLDDKSYGPGIDGLLGMSFLSRFELQLAGGFIEIRTRRPK
jgi:clan AA aspartic protease (TIGR02281 family)